MHSAMDKTNVDITFKENIPSCVKRIVIMASYNGKGKIADYVVYYLQELHKVADAIIFVADNEVYKEEVDKIKDLVVHASFYHHGSYDFGSYHIGFVWAEQHHLLDEADELVLCNDSCYGPVFPLKDVFDKMDGKGCDFWGLQDSREDIHHILSFFLTFRRQVFTSPVFCNFVHSFRKLDSFWDYVNQYEKQFTRVLEKAGYQCATYVDIDDDTKLRYAYHAGNGNLMLFPLTMLRHKMPLIKVKALNNVFGVDLHESPLQTMEEIKKVNEPLYHIIHEDLKSRNVVVDDRWLSASQIIGDAKVVSFDIFDTLLARPYTRPTDLFVHMEHELERPGFAKKRVNAELKARKLHKEQADVSLEQIYSVIDSKYQDLKEQELRYEADMLFVKEDGRRIYEEAVRLGRKVIAVSDMYLPGHFLARLLQSKGYQHISTVFVSNEEDCCKGDGRLFKRVLEKLAIAPTDMVHIGDNPISDKEAPQKLGIRAVIRKSYIDQIRDLPSQAKLQCFANEDGLTRSILNGIICQHKINHKLTDPFFETGYVLGGPLAVGYARHIYAEAKKRHIDGILFVSRDGYAIKKIYEQICPHDIPTYYIQTSRALTLRNDCSYEGEVYRKKVFDMFAKEQGVSVKYSAENFERYLPELRKWTIHNNAQYQKYIEGLNIKGQHLMTVDMTTREFTSLKVLTKIFGKRIDCGMFSITFDNPSEHTVLSYANKHWKAGEEVLLMLQEELITAPYTTAEAIDDNGEFVYADWNITELRRVENYKKILDGICEFAKDFVRLSAGHKVDISYEDCWQLMLNFIEMTNYGDQELYKRIYHEDGINGRYTTIQEQINLFHSIQVRNYTPTEIATLEKSVARYAKKNGKHLKALRYALIALGAETAALLALLLNYLI